MSLQALQEVIEVMEKTLGKEKAGELINDALKDVGARMDTPGQIEIPIAGFGETVRELAQTVEELPDEIETALSEMSKGFKSVGMPAMGAGALIHVLLYQMREIKRLNKAVAKLTELLAED